MAENEEHEYSGGEEESLEDMLEDLGEEYEEMEEFETQPVIEEPEEVREPKIKEAETELDESWEEPAKIGLISGRLVDIILILVAIFMVIFFLTNSLYEDVEKINDIAMGMLLNIGLVGLVVIVLLYVAASNNIAKGDALSRLDTPEGYKAAIEKYDMALKIDRRSKKAWTCKGLAMRMLSHDKENLMRALKCHNRALKIDPKYSIAWVNKGNVLFNLGAPDEAMKCYDKAIDLDPDYTVAWVNKGEMLVKLGRRDEAQKCLDRAQSLT
ncbi:MAG: tetratricopeptide repeat protein [Thermoplasmata archaeon]|nr:MAG: tetratricopeptide repeat protein [Thermoplasmata archaeon]